MSDSSELLLLRLALTGIIFVFVFATALTLRSGLRASPVEARKMARRVAGPRLTLVAPGSTGLAPGAEFAVAGTMTVGRDAGNSIVLADPSVSGRHARIERTRDGWRLFDSGSTNGTVVNGRRVDGRGAILRGGEHVTIGAIVLRFSG